MMFPRYISDFCCIHSGTFPSLYIMNFSFTLPMRPSSSFISGCSNSCSSCIVSALKSTSSLMHYKSEVEDNDEADGKIQRSKRVKKSDAREHVLTTSPVFADIFVRGEWKKHPRRRYIQHRCRTFKCKARVRTYCSCNAGHWMCQQCFGKHCSECNPLL